MICEAGVTGPPALSNLCISTRGVRMVRTYREVQSDVMQQMKVFLQPRSRLSPPQHMQRHQTVRLQLVIGDSSSYSVSVKGTCTPA